MKKFGRKNQYYQKNENSYIKINSQNEFVYYDPVDLDFINEFEEGSKSNMNSNTKSRLKTPTFKTPTQNSNSSNKNYFRLSELNNNNPYNILETSESANEDEIRKAYKKLIILHHPDKGGDPILFNKTHEAYKILSNPITKKIVDTFGSISMEIVKNIIDNEFLLNSKQFIREVEMSIQQNDFTQLYLICSVIKN